MSALSSLKQRLSTVNHSAIALFTANSLPDDIVGASVLTALFPFRAILMTQDGGYGKVRTLWIYILFAITMQMTILIDNVWCFDYVGC
jgi:hypothetical protein